MKHAGSSVAPSAALISFAADALLILLLPHCALSCFSSTAPATLLLNPPLRLAAAALSFDPSHHCIRASLSLRFALFGGRTSLAACPLAIILPLSSLIRVSRYVEETARREERVRNAPSLLFKDVEIPLLTVMFVVHCVRCAYLLRLPSSSPLIIGWSLVFLTHSSRHRAPICNTVRISVFSKSVYIALLSLLMTFFLSVYCKRFHALNNPVRFHWARPPAMRSRLPLPLSPSSPCTTQQQSRANPIAQPSPCRRGYPR